MDVKNSSKRQTVFFLLVDLMDKSHKDPHVIDLYVPRHAQYLHNAWKRHQDAVYWVDINLAVEKGLTFYQTRSNAIIFQETFPAYCIPKVVQMKTGEVLYEKVYMSHRFPSKISLKHEWKRELGSDHAQRSEVGQLSGGFQWKQPILNPICERKVRPFTEKPVNETSVIQARSSEDRKNFNVEQAHERTRRLVSVTNTENVSVSSQTRSAHESETFNVGDEILRKRTERSVADHDVSHESMMVNEADMDFRIPGLPHSVAKYAQSTSVRELIQKLENHPDRHALQQDLRQNQSVNPFSPESKQIIQDVGNIELCELLVQSVPTILEYWYDLCTCGHFLHKERGTNQPSINCTMDLLSVPEYVIKKGILHGHRSGKKPRDK